jgi:hypothetical protein
MLLAAAMLAVMVAPAAAYTSYLKPASYWPEGDDVSVEGSFASQFFTPQIAVPAELVGLNPDGTSIVFENVAVQGASTVLEADLPSGGTYRISTGEQVGNVTSLVGVDGQWRPLAAGETPPEGAATTTLQTVTLADVYVTRGQASREVVDQPHGRLALRPVPTATASLPSRSKRPATTSSPRAIAPTCRRDRPRKSAAIRRP